MKSLHWLASLAVLGLIACTAQSEDPQTPDPALESTEDAVVGKACSADPQCATTQYCADAAPRQCRGREENGARCSRDRVCKSSLCNAPTYTCVARNSQPGGAFCDRNDVCQSSVCDAPTHRCRQPEGGSCNIDTECAPGFLCNQSTRRCAKPDPYRGPCRRDMECKSNICNQVTYTCADKGTADAGQPCDRITICRSNSCDLASHRCRQSDGGACYQDVECVSGQCNQASHRCDRPQYDNGPCARDSECVSRKCNLAQSQCAPSMGEVGGERCARNLECQSSVCDASTHLCKQTDGGWCTADAACASGHCIGYRCDRQHWAGQSCDKDFDCMSNQCDEVAHRCQY